MQLPKNTQLAGGGPEPKYIPRAKTWSELVGRITIDWPYGTEIRCSEGKVIGGAYEQGYDTHLMIIQSTLDRDTREATRVITHDYPPDIRGVSDPVSYIKGLVMSALQHELHELTKIDGMRAYDPHTHEAVVMV